MRLTASLPTRGIVFSVKCRSPLRGSSWRWDSNPRPADYKSAALPTELRQRQVKTQRRAHILSRKWLKMCARTVIRDYKYRIFFLRVNVIMPNLQEIAHQNAGQRSFLYLGPEPQCGNERRIEREGPTDRLPCFRQMAGAR